MACLPSDYVTIAIENGPVEIVDLPTVNVYQRVTTFQSSLEQSKLFLAFFEVRSTPG